MVTAREQMESAVMELCRDVRPIASEDSYLINTFKDGRFGVSFLSYIIYANGYNERGMSRKHPLGLIYDDGSTRFALGFFARESDDTVHMHIIAPVGSLLTVDRFVKTIQDKMPGLTCYIRHLTSQQRTHLNRLGYHTVTAGCSQKWHPGAFAEDETFNHRVVDISAAFGKHFRRNIRQFERFQSAANRLDIREYTPGQLSDAEFIIRSHFRWLKSRNKNIGSSWEDYMGVVENLPAGKNGHDYFAYIGYLQKKPAMLFIGERTGKTAAGLYSCFALRHLHKNRDYSNGISSYAYMHAFGNMRKAGIREVDVGGSETTDLDDFKRRTLCAREAPTYWVVPSHPLYATETRLPS
ncbi:MAG: hypothetical protein ABH879_05385 [archaeon]